MNGRWTARRERRLRLPAPATSKCTAVSDNRTYSGCNLANWVDYYNAVRIRCIDTSPVACRWRLTPQPVWLLVPASLTTFEYYKPGQIDRQTAILTGLVSLTSELLKVLVGYAKYQIWNYIDEARRWFGRCQIQDINTARIMWIRKWNSKLDLQIINLHVTIYCLLLSTFMMLEVAFSFKLHSFKILSPLALLNCT